MEAIEAIAETDEDLTLRYLEGDTFEADELRAALRKATIANQLVPILCGTALRNKGVQLLLDAVVAYLPSPLDVPPATAIDPRTGRRDHAVRPTRTGRSRHWPSRSLATRTSASWPTSGSTPAS